MHVYLFPSGRCLPFSLSYVRIGCDRIDFSLLSIQFFFQLFFHPSGASLLIKAGHRGVESAPGNYWNAIFIIAVVALRAAFQHQRGYRGQLGPPVWSHEWWHVGMLILGVLIHHRFRFNYEMANLCFPFAGKGDAFLLQVLLFGCALWTCAEVNGVWGTRGWFVQCRK